MKTFLMHKDRHFDPKENLPWNEAALIQDLELNVLFEAMSLGDDFLYEAAKKSVLMSLKNPAVIKYRQSILRDCFKNFSVINEIYHIAVESIEYRKSLFWGFSSSYPSTILYVSVESMGIFIEMLKKLKEIADKNIHKFESEGFVNLFKKFQADLTEEFFTNSQKHLKQLKHDNEVLISAQLGKGNKGTNFILHQMRGSLESVIQWIVWVLKEILPGFLFDQKPPPYTFYLHPRDENGARILKELKEKGLNHVADILAQATDHLLDFFIMLRIELAFYIGCLNLYGQLVKIGVQICYPEPLAAQVREHSFNGLYNICLTLKLKQKVISNDSDAHDKEIIIITGANQGGKSTFLQSIGIAQLMMQCGMFVPSDSFKANICESLFTHYRRKEDTTMKSGKLDEELHRMSGIVDHISKNSMILFNESFAATNEREGSEIAVQIVSALLEKKIKIFFVTHQFEFARKLYDKNLITTLFLRAERQENGQRNFKLIKGEPLKTSFGIDLYYRIFQSNR